MLKVLRTSVVFLIAMTVITGVVYPLAVTAFIQIVFHEQANGSLVMRDGIVVGSSLIGQTNNEPGYFWPRPSAMGYGEGDSLISSGATNRSLTSVDLVTEADQRETEFSAANGLGTEASVPQEMLFASGSGLDPHISPEAALLQAERVAQARGLSIDDVIDLINMVAEQPQLGFLGESRVNVLMLNLALDQLE